MADRLRQGSRGLQVYESPEQARRIAWVQMAHAFGAIERRVIDLLGQHEMTLPQFDVLATLLFSEGASQQELAKRLLVTKGNVVGLLNRLEAAGWVERRPHATDARANCLHLTPAGRRKIDKVLPEHDALIAQLFRTVTGADLAVLRRCCDLLIEVSEPKR